MFPQQRWRCYLVPDFGSRDVARNRAPFAPAPYKQGRAELEAIGLKAHGCKTIYPVARPTESTAIGCRDLLRESFTVRWGEQGVIIVAPVHAV